MRSASNKVSICFCTTKNLDTATLKQSWDACEQIDKKKTKNKVFKKTNLFCCFC